MKFLTWQNSEQLIVAQNVINNVKLKGCGIKDQLKSVKTHEGVRYLLYFSVDKCDNDEIGNRQASIRDFMDAFPCENITYWNIGESSSQIVALFASIPIE